MHNIYSVVEKKESRWYNVYVEPKNTQTDEREGKHVAVLAKPINRMSVIKKQESQEFVREFNKNKVSEDFLDSCKKAGKLFEKEK